MLPLYLESKVQSTPFRKAQEKFGIEPGKCITINVKNLKKYKNLPCLIVFIVDYQEYSTSGFYCISSKKLWQLYKSHPEWHYTLKFRGRKHKTKNFVFSIDYCYPLEKVLDCLNEIFGG